VFTEPCREDDSNLTRLRLVMRLFRITQADIHKATHYSRPFVSRLLKGSLRAGPRFWGKLNSELLKLISEAGTWSSVFRVES